MVKYFILAAVAAGIFASGYMLRSGEVKALKAQAQLYSDQLASLASAADAARKSAEEAARKREESLKKLKDSEINRLTTENLSCNQMLQVVREWGAKHVE
jgi:uncharacterized coiled-coil DUF342 family protein